MLHKYFENSTSVMCIGAMDGHSFDEFYPYITEYAQQFTTGIFVEPIPWWFDELKNTYSAFPQFEFENSALTLENGTFPMTTIRPEKADGLFEFWWMKGASVIGEEFTNLRLDVNPHHKTNQELTPYKEVIQVNGITFQSLADKYKLEHIDLIQIDTEGHDWKVLQQINLEKYNPKMILVEVIHLTEQDKQEMTEFLTTNKYTIEVFQQNTDNWVVSK